MQLVSKEEAKQWWGGGWLSTWSSTVDSGCQTCWTGCSSLSWLLRSLSRGTTWGICITSMWTRAFLWNLRQTCCWFRWRCTFSPMTFMNFDSSVWLCFVCPLTLDSDFCNDTFKHAVWDYDTVPVQHISYIDWILSVSVFPLGWIHINKKQKNIFKCAQESARLA